MKRGIWLAYVCLALVLAMSLVFGSCAPKEAPAPAPTPAPAPKKLELTMVNWNTPDHFFQAGHRAFAKNVTERTKGQATIKVVDAVAIGIKWQDILPSLKEESTQIQSAATFYVSGQSPLFSLGWIPLFVESHAQMALADHVVRDFFQGELNKFGVQLLAHWPYDEQYIASSVPIRKLDDFKGLRIRPTGAEFAEVLQAVGATPVSMPVADIQMAAQKALLNGWSIGADWQGKFTWEVFKYALDYPWGTGDQLFLMSKRVYDTLPGDARSIILEEAQKLAAAQYSEARAATDRGLKAMKEHGMQFISHDEATKAQLRSVASAVLDKWGAKSPECGEMLRRIRLTLGK